METIKLVAQPRTQLGKKVKELRINGLIPAVLYGKDNKPINLQIDSKKFKVVYNKAGSSSLVDLEIHNQEPIKVLIQDVQENPISNEPIHIDFYAIRMDEEITTEIPLKFVGIASAVKDLEGNLVKNYDKIEVECLPIDLISEINVDISSLKTFEDQIKIKDLNIPEKLKVIDDLESVVAVVTPPRSEEELEAMETEAAADKEKEVVEEMEKKDEEEKLAKEGEEGKEGDEKKEEKAGSDKPNETGKKKEKKKE